ncbi:MAG: hypothetical protein IPJ03_02715 [Ignavibacteriales bacterium]|nr:hypothetical protein [Ignavibacteriales bacterium]
MSRILLGIISGAIFGAVSVASMIPIKMEQKRIAMLGAFTNRFAIGFVICNSSLPMAGWLNGLLLAILLSIPDAIITKAWIPIMSLGIVGGIVIGIIATT